MELKVVEYTKNKLKFNILGEDHTLANILRKELWNDKNVEKAGYSLEHALVTSPKFFLETNNKDPKEIMDNAVKRLKKLNESLLSNIKKLF